MAYTTFFPAPKDLQPFPSALDSLDLLIGGGLPRGGIVEIFGPSGCGKSALALHWCAQAQQSGATAAWVDSDHTLNATWAERCGVRIADLVALQPTDGDSALSMLCELLRTFSLDFAVVDPVAALDPAEPSDGADPVTELLHRHLRKIRFALERSGASLLLVNQTRFIGDRERSCGDTAIAVNAAVRLHMEPLSRDSGVRQVRLRAEKNRTGEPFGECTLNWDGARWSDTQRKPAVRTHPEPSRTAFGTGL